MSVDWVLNNSKYELSSKNHFLQLMSNGTLFSDTGTPPTNYWSSDYIQTDDVDLESDGNIVPIGNSNDPFSGSFDGSGYAITDWAYDNASDSNVGFFGYISDALIQNVNMEGSWVLSSGSQCGFLVGECESSNIHNVTADFSSGSIASTGTSVGGLVGTSSGSIIEGLTMKGVLSTITGTTNVGGIVGSITDGSSLNYVRNMVRFTGSPSISGTSCAGICSHVSSSDSSYIMSAMIGSITGVDNAGGIFSTIENTSSNSISHIINSMTGSISSTGTSSSAGGIASTVQSDGNSLFQMNTLATYGSCSISGTNNSGGIIGSIMDGVEIINSVIAMNGTVEYAGVQTSTGSNNSIEVQIINTFGLVYTNPGVDVSLTALTGSFGVHAGFSDLEYFAMEGTDTVGNHYTWEFAFGNLSGSTNHSQYTHAVVSSSDVCGPIEIQVNLTDNSVEYIYFMNIDSNEVVAEPGLSISYSDVTVVDTLGSVLYPTPPVIVVITSPFSVELSWDGFIDSVSYKVAYGLTSTGSLDRSVLSETNSVDIFNLDESSEYSFQIYSSTDGSNFVLEDGITGSATTLTNTASSYLLSRFLVDDVYDLSGFSPEKTSQIASIIPNLLGQDESILMRVDGQIRELLVAGVSGSVLDTQDGDQYILPFNASDGSAQSMVIEGVYEGFLAYNELDDSVTIDGQEYFAGDSIVVGDVRITLNSV